MTVIHALETCNIDHATTHQNRATHFNSSCTGNVQPDGAHHAREGVQHHSPQPCTTSVQLTLHHSSAIQDNRYRTTNPVMHMRARRTKDIYRNLTTGLRKSGTNPEPTDRARGVAVATR